MRHMRNENWKYSYEHRNNTWRVNNRGNVGKFSHWNNDYNHVNRERTKSMWPTIPLFFVSLTFSTLTHTSFLNHPFLLRTPVSISEPNQTSPSLPWSTIRSPLTSPHLTSSLLLMKQGKVVTDWLRRKRWRPRWRKRVWLWGYHRKCFSP